MIETRNLYKNYGGRVALRDVNFSVGKGEVVGFLGPNGAGKTTTMKILTGYMSPTRGSALIDGRDISEHPVELKKQIGYLPEVPPLYRNMYVRDYLQYVARLKCCPGRHIPRLIDRAVEKTGLESVQNRLIDNLSKGFRQRTGLAQAILSEPDILILDEPTVGLDPRQVVEIRELLAGLKGQHTIILSTHILSEVQVSCDRVIIIHNGEIVETGKLKDLTLSNQRKLTLKTRTAPPDLMEKLKSLKGVLNVSQKNGALEVSADQSVNEEVARTVVNGNFGLLEMKETGPDLEEIFIRLTDEENKKKEGNSDK